MLVTVSPAPLDLHTFPSSPATSAETEGSDLTWLDHNDTILLLGLTGAETRTHHPKFYLCTFLLCGIVMGTVSTVPVLWDLHSTSSPTTSAEEEDVSKSDYSTTMAGLGLTGVDQSTQDPPCKQFETSSKSRSLKPGTHQFDHPNRGT